MKHFIKAAAAAALLLVTHSGPGKAEETTLDVSVPVSSELKTMHEALAAAFVKEHPEIKIKLDFSSKDYEDLLQRNLRQAVTGGLPDVAFHVYNRVSLLADRKLPQPLDRFVASEDLSAQGYLPSMLTLAQANGHFYGLPFNTSTIVVYYNKDLVKQAGGDTGKLPQTWPEITALSLKIGKLGNGVSGIYYDYDESSGNWSFISLVESLGGQMMSPDSNAITFDRKPGMDALHVLQQVGGSGFTDMSRDQARQAFSTGKLGIFVVSTSYLKELTDGAKGHFELGVGQFPIVENGHLPAGGNAAMMFTKDPNKQKAAWEYIKFAAGPVGQTIVANTSGYIPSNTLSIERPDLLGAAFKTDTNRMVAMNQIKYLDGFFAFPGPNSVKISEVIRHHLRDVILLRRSPEEVMPDMVKEVRDLLPQS